MKFNENTTQDKFFMDKWCKEDMAKYGHCFYDWRGWIPLQYHYDIDLFLYEPMKLGYYGT